VRCSSSSSFDGQFDPYTLQSQIASNRLQHGREASQKAAVRQVLEGVYSTEDLEAASLLSGMLHSNANETITLFEGARSIVDQRSHRGYRFLSSEGEGDPLLQDETLLMLDRLRDLTRKAAYLEDHLRDDYLDKRRRLLSSDYVDTVTVGQAGLLAELKMANDNLRWRLQQKQLANRAQKAIIINLQERLFEAEARIKDLEKATDNRSNSTAVLSGAVEQPTMMMI